MDAMTQVPTRSEIEQAVAFGVRAPSVHNTQPWRWVFRAGVLELYADRSRQLPALDPDGRSMLLSCGAALELARLGLAAAGWESAVDRTVEGDLVGRIRPTRRVPVPAETVERARAAERRQTDRRPFRPEPVPEGLVDVLLAAAAGPGVYAYAVRRAEERLDLAVVTSWADRVETADPAYRAELARWTRPADAMAPDGIPAEAVPHAPAGGPRHTEVPVRDFEAGITGGQPLVELVDEQPLYLVVFSTGDDAAARVAAGEAYARVSVEAQRLGLASSALTQAVDLPAVRERFRTLMNWADHPQMVLRVGHPAGGPAPATGRRPLSEVLTVVED